MYGKPDLGLEPSDVAVKEQLDWRPSPTDRMRWHMCDSFCIGEDDGSRGSPHDAKWVRLSPPKMETGLHLQPKRVLTGPTTPQSRG